MLAQDETNHLLAQILEELKDIKGLMKRDSYVVISDAMDRMAEEIKVGGTD